MYVIDAPLALVEPISLAVRRSFPKEASEGEWIAQGIYGMRLTSRSGESMTCRGSFALFFPKQLPQLTSSSTRHLSSEAAGSAAFAIAGTARDWDEWV